MQKILVVDDNPEIIDVIKLRLEASGYEVIFATDGKEGIKKAKLQQPDLIIMDIMMPNLSGGDAVALLRVDSLTKEIPILFLTAITADLPTAEDRGINVDGQFYPAISKPFDPKKLLNVIKELLGNAY